MRSREHIHVVGETSLVLEYCSLSLSKKLAVTLRPNPGETVRLPKGARKATSPPKSTTAVFELTNISVDIKKKNLVQLDSGLATSVPIISSSTTVTVAEQSTWIKNPQRLIGIGALPSLLEGSLIELAPGGTTTEQTIGRARGLAATLGKEVALVQDCIGLIMPRILCMLANESYFAMAEGVASANDIDTAMRLGTNYPSGPVERAEKIGINHVYAVLAALFKHFGEDRYRIAPLLRQAVARDS